MFGFMVNNERSWALNTCFFTRTQHVTGQVLLRQNHTRALTHTIRYDQEKLIRGGTVPLKTRDTHKLHTCSGGDTNNN